jgi:hypothetical protein
MSPQVKPQIRASIPLNYAERRPIIDLAGKRIRRRPVLGGLINEYEAA